MLLCNAFQEYLANFKTALVFGLLLVLSPIAFLLGNTFISSGSIFLDYSLSLASPLQIVFAIIFAIFYLALYSFFVSIIIFSVRKDLSSLHFNFYLNEMIRKFTSKIFYFYLGFFILIFAIGAVLFFFNVPAIITAIIILLISASLLFVPQSIVLDEEEIPYAISANFEFIRKRFSSFAYVFITAILLLIIAQIIELGLDAFSNIGGFVSLLIALVFIVPYIEVLKTYIYMLRYGLIKAPELLHRKLPRKKQHHRSVRA